MSLPWATVAEEFVFDGSWHDIVVADTTVADWQAAIDALRRAPLRTSFTVAGVEAPLPADVQEVFDGDGVGRLLKVFAGSVTFYCHFFAACEIEFDLDPRDVTSQGPLGEVVAFMSLLADSCQKAALLTPENLHEMPILRLRPGSEPEHVPRPQAAVSP